MSSPSSSDRETYLEIVRRSVRPKAHQLRAFAHHVSIDHSWYKHLPSSGVGEPFFLWLKPHAHMVSVDHLDDGRAWRSIVREIRPDDGSIASIIPSFRIDYLEGDVALDSRQPVEWLAGRWSTEEWSERFGSFSYWNHGPPDQPRADALDAAAEFLRYGDDHVHARPVPPEVLELGLVYLRASIYPTEAHHGNIGTAGRRLADDRQEQFDEIIAAMSRVVSYVYGDDPASEILTGLSD